MVAVRRSATVAADGMAGDDGEQSVSDLMLDRVGGPEIHPLEPGDLDLGLAPPPERIEE